MVHNKGIVCLYFLYIYYVFIVVYFITEQKKAFSKIITNNHMNQTACGNGISQQEFRVFIAWSFKFMEIDVHVAIKFFTNNW